MCCLVHFCRCAIDRFVVCGALSSYFLSSCLIAHSFRVLLNSAAAHVVRDMRISLSALAFNSPPKSSSAAFIIMERVRALAAEIVSMEVARFKIGFLVFCACNLVIMAHKYAHQNSAFLAAVGPLPRPFKINHDATYHTSYMAIPKYLVGKSEAIHSDAPGWCHFKCCHSAFCNWVKQQGQGERQVKVNGPEKPGPAGF